MKFWSFAGVQEKIVELFGIDRRSLALMRVFVALIVVYDLYQRARFLFDHYGAASIFPPEAIWNGEWGAPWPILFKAMELWPYFPAYFFVVGFVAALFLLIGWKTRIAAVCTWVSVFAIQLMDPIVLQGGDITMRLVLFLGIFLPWGSAYAVDALSEAKQKAWTYLSPVTAIYLLQFGMIYLFANLEKKAPEWIPDGTAVYYALSIDHFSTPVGEFMLNFPLILMALTFAVHLVQFMAFYLLFFPFATFATRSTVLVMLLLMHISFGIHMNLGAFSWISVCALLAFLPFRFWEWVTKWWEGRWGNLTLYYDADCGFCKKSVYLIRMFLLLPKTEIRLAQEHPSIWEDMQREDSWVIETPDGKRFFRFGGGLAIARRSPLLFWLVPLAQLPFCYRIGEWVYRYIAKNRSRVCLPAIHKTPVARPYWEAFGTIVLLWLSILYIVFVFLWNYSNRYPHSVTASFFTEHSQHLRELGIDQYWSMFAPFPMKDDGWFIIEGITPDGKRINLFDVGAPLPFQKPENVSAMYPNERWRKYLMNLYFDMFIPFRKYYTAYLCNKWNAEEDQVQKVTVIYMLERTLPDYKPFPIQRLELEWRNCALRKPPSMPVDWEPGLNAR